MIIFCWVGCNWRIGIFGLGKIFIKFVFCFFWLVDFRDGLFFVVLLFVKKICGRWVNNFDWFWFIFWFWFSYDVFELIEGDVFVEDVIKFKIFFDVFKVFFIVVFFGGIFKFCGFFLFFSVGLLLILEIYVIGDSNVFFVRGRFLI